MADDSSTEFAPRMHPDDLAALSRRNADVIAEALARAPAMPPPGRPPVDLDGYDAKVWSKAARIEIERAVDKFLTKDQIEDMVVRITADKTGVFLTKDQITALILSTNIAQFKAIGIRLDEEHIEETGELIRKNMKWTKDIDGLAKKFTYGLMAAIGYTLLKLVGVNVPWFGGGDH